MNQHASLEEPIKAEWIPGVGPMHAELSSACERKDKINVALTGSGMEVRKEKPMQMQRKLQCNANMIFEGCAISQNDQENAQTFFFLFFPKPRFTLSNQRHGWGCTSTA